MTKPQRCRKSWGSTNRLRVGKH